jgi:hypothetical protein
LNHFLSAEVASLFRIAPETARLGHTPFSVKNATPVLKGVIGNFSPNAGLFQEGIREADFE